MAFSVPLLGLQHYVCWSFRLSSLFFSLFSFCSSDSVLSIVLSSSLLILSSAGSHLFLSSSTEFFISVIVFFFLPPRFLFWFLFMFSTTLLIFSLCSQHHFPIFLHVFYGFLSILRLLFKSLSSMSATQVSSRMFSPLMGHTFLFLYALWYFVEEMFESYNLTPEIIFPSFPRICCLLVF